MTTPDFIDELRRMSTEDLEGLGQRSLLDHLVAQAQVARGRHAPFLGSQLDDLLQDRTCVRHPVRLVFEFGEMALHQFAQPDIDWRNVEQGGRVLYLRPLLRERPEGILLAVAYLLPVINYGDIVTDEHCVHFGAALLGLAPEEFYRRICALADEVGAEARAGEAPDDAPLRLAAPVAVPAFSCEGSCG